MSLWLFLALYSALDESRFSNAPACPCAIHAGQCNPYCCCDPYCSADQKRSFDFCLPDGNQALKISCDPRGYIGKANLKSIATFEINNVTCYALLPDASGEEQIKSYTAADFGLNSFAELGEIPVLPNRTISHDSVYRQGDFLLVSYQNSPAPLMMPASLGSHSCNVQVEVRVGQSFAASCYRPGSVNYDEVFDVLLSSTGSVPYYPRPDSVESIPTDCTTISGPDVGSCSGFWTDLRTGRGAEVTIYVTMVEGVIVPNGFTIGIISLSGRGSLLQTNFLFANPEGEYLLMRGYVIGETLRGTPRQVSELRADCPNVKESGGQAVSLDKLPVRFGVNAVHIVTPTPGPRIEPSTIWAAPGDIIVQAEPTCNDFLIPEAMPTVGRRGEIPRVRITFGYQKFGRPGKFVYIIVSAHNQTNFPEDASINWRYEIVEIVWTELNPDSSVVQPNPGSRYETRLGLFFDFFFRRRSDIMKTIGVFPLVAVLATFWSYYAFF
jgi:hypothetical protein